MNIPVIILTISEYEKDIRESYHNHANCYIVKPINNDKLMEIAQTIKDFWISIVKLL